MDWLEALDLQAYWLVNPPIHIIAKAAWFQSKDSESFDVTTPNMKPEDPANQAAQSVFAAQIGGGQGRSIASLPAGLQKGIMSAIGATQ